MAHPLHSSSKLRGEKDFGIIASHGSATVIRLAHTPPHHNPCRSATVQWLPWPMPSPPHCNHQVYSQTKEGLTFLWLRKALTKSWLISGRYRRVPLPTPPPNCSRNVWSSCLETGKEPSPERLGNVWANPAGTKQES